MNHALKVLGLSLLAALALGGLTASAASAEFFVFTSETEKSTLSGEQSGASTFKVDAGSFKCESATFIGEMEQEGAVELALAPEYKSCSFAGVSGSEVAMHSCHYIFRVVSREGTTNKGDGVVDCEEAGDKITFTAKVAGVTKCTVDVREQESLSEIKFENEGSPQKVKAIINLSGVKYEQTAGTGLGACAKAENTTNGTYESTVAIKDLSGETQKKLVLEPIPQKVKIDKNPVTFGGKVNDTETFEVENVVAEAVAVIAMIRPPNILRSKIGCGKLAAKNAKCQEEIKCAALTGIDHKLAILTSPLGGDMTTVKKC